MFFLCVAHTQKGVKQRHGRRCSHFERVAQDAPDSSVFSNYETILNYIKYSRK